MDWGKYDYAKEVEIDLGRLDEEWRKHPGLVIKYNEAKADANRTLDEAKERADLVIARVNADIRQSIEDEGGKKPTEKAIENMVLTDCDVQDAKQAVIEARHNVNLLAAACAGFDARGQALSNAVRLYTSSYFAEPAADIEARGYIEKAYSEGANAKVQISRRSKRTEDDPAPTRKGSGGMSRNK